jgi:hypothetical protein
LIGRERVKDKREGKGMKKRAFYGERCKYMVTLLLGGEKVVFLLDTSPSHSMEAQ